MKFGTEIYQYDLDKNEFVLLGVYYKDGFYNGRDTKIYKGPDGIDGNITSDYNYIKKTSYEIHGV